MKIKTTLLVALAVTAACTYGVGSFALASEKVTPQQFIDLQQGQSMHAGFRRAHAKGMCVQGEFRSNGNLSDLTKASIFEVGQTPFIGRFSIAGNNPTAPDLKAPVRSLALSFSPSATQQWRIAMNTPPVMAVADPHTFYQQIMAIQQGSEAVQLFFSNHPESADFLEWKASYEPTKSFATEIYNSINAFYLISGAGKKQAVRWHFEPVPTADDDPVPLMLDNADALQHELALRLEEGPVVFNWVFTLATAADDEADPTQIWPDDREQRVAGQLFIHTWQPQLEGSCHAINYDPLVLPTGIEATADPILRARSGAYAESYRRRAVEVLSGAHEERTNEQ